VHWVAVPKVLRARRANRRHHPAPSAAAGGSSRKTMAEPPAPAPAAGGAAGAQQWPRQSKKVHIVDGIPNGVCPRRRSSRCRQPPPPPPPPPPRVWLPAVESMPFFDPGERVQCPSCRRWMEAPTSPAPAVRQAFPSWMRSILTEIGLCRTCSCQEILRMETPGQAQGLICALDTCRAYIWPRREMACGGSAATAQPSLRATDQAQLLPPATTRSFPAAAAAAGEEQGGGGEGARRASKRLRARSSASRAEGGAVAVSLLLSVHDTGEYGQQQVKLLSPAEMLADQVSRTAS
jgi:hypothetical protein